MSAHTKLRVVGIYSSPDHVVPKPAVDTLEFVAGLGIVGDAHSGSTIRHRSRVRSDPSKPNLRQVHFTSLPTYENLARRDIHLSPGAIGENVCVAGLQMLDLPAGTVVALGAGASAALIALTGLRNPCVQLDPIHPDLRVALREPDPAATDGVRLLAGVFGIVIRGGTARAGDEVSYSLPPTPHSRLERV